MNAFNNEGNKQRRYSKAEYDTVMRLRAQGLRHTEIERRSGIPIGTFQGWFYEGYKPWSARTAEENHRSYSYIRKHSEKAIAKMRHMGSDNPIWKGDEATEEAIRQRLHRSMPVPKGHERHHIDGNVRNNDPSNILVLTRRKHMIEDGRMEAWIKRNKMRRGMQLSPETKAKMSEAHSGSKHHMWGKKHTPETIEKIRSAQIGKKHTPETKEKISATLKARARNKIEALKGGANNSSF